MNKDNKKRKRLVFKSNKKSIAQIKALPEEIEYNSVITYLMRPSKLISLRRHDMYQTKQGTCYAISMEEYFSAITLKVHYM